MTQRQQGPGLFVDGMYRTGESVTFDGAAMSGGSTISMSGSLTNSGGDILLTKASAQSITASNGGDLTVESNANTIIESVTFDGAAAGFYRHFHPN